VKSSLARGLCKRLRLGDVRILSAIVLSFLHHVREFGIGVYAFAFVMRIAFPLVVVVGSKKSEI